MKRLLRTFVMLPLLALLLVAVPALLLSLIQEPGSDAGVYASAYAKTVPPGNGTVPVTPTPTRPWRPPHRPPHHPPHRPPYQPGPVYPTATPLPTPTATPLPGDQDALTVGGYTLRKVIGDRLSPVIYAFTTNDRLYRSTNNGRSWSLVTTRPAVDNFIMSPADPYVLYGGQPLECGENSSFAAPVFVSADGGAGFTAWETPVSLTPLLAHPTDPGRALAAACDGLYLTGDGGRSWQVLSDANETALWRDYVAVEMAAAYNTAEEGEPDWQHLYVIAEDADGVAVVAYSNDEGDTWGQISPSGVTTPFSISSLAADPDTAGRVWVAELQGVWGTQDNGLFWGLSNQGLESVLDRGYAGRQLGLNDVTLHPSGMLYLGTGVGLYEKPAHDTEWVKSGAEDAPFRLEAVNSILFTDGRPEVLWLNTGAGVFQHEVNVE